MTALAKDTRLHIRCDHEVRCLLDKAAAYGHMSVSEFVLSHALAKTQSLVDTPPQANAALQRA